VHQGDKPAAKRFPDAVLEKLEALKATSAESEAFGPGSRKIELKRR
jgi:hypothetical protein